jgi:hypothetical protein
LAGYVTYANTVNTFGQLSAESGILRTEQGLVDLGVVVLLFIYFFQLDGAFIVVVVLTVLVHGTHGTFAVLARLLLAA